MRYAWEMTFDYLNSSIAGKGLPGILTRQLLHRLRQWDAISANRVDYFVANSRHTAQRIWRCYRRKAEVIYPPVNIERFSVQPDKQDFYLTVSRLVSYKKVSLIVQAFNQLGRPLVVIGSGPELPLIRKMAKPNVRVLGWQPAEVVEKYMAEAKAFVYAACEDFGMALVEAQACGTPVIAYGAGGALETVLDIQQHPDLGTGVFFAQQSPAALIKAVDTFEASQPAFSPKRVRANADKFAPTICKERYMAYLDHCYQEFEARNLG